jgi:hypothetical protein
MFFSTYIERISKPFSAQQQQQQQTQQQQQPANLSEHQRQDQLQFSTSDTAKNLICEILTSASASHAFVSISFT